MIKSWKCSKCSVLLQCSQFAQQKAVSKWFWWNVQDHHRLRGLDALDKPFARSSCIALSISRSFASFFAFLSCAKLAMSDSKGLLFFVLRAFFAAFFSIFLSFFAALQVFEWLQCQNYMLSATVQACPNEKEPFWLSYPSSYPSCLSLLGLHHHLRAYTAQGSFGVV